MSLNFAYVSFMLVAIGCSSVDRSSQTSSYKLDCRIQAKRDAVLRAFHADRTKETAITLQQLLAGRDPDEFLFDEHPVISLYAGWRKMIKLQESHMAIDGVSARRFLEHFYLCTGQSPSFKWAELFPRELIQHPEPKVIGLGVFAEGALPRPEQQAVTRSFDASLTVQDGGSDLVYCKGNRKLRVPKSFLARQASKPLFLDAVEILFCDEEVFLIRYSDIVNTICDLYCFDARSGALHWRRDVWGRPPGTGSGPGSGVQFLEIVRNQDAVLVFGVSARSRFAEAFHAASGETMWRFSSDLWSFSANSELSK